MCVLQSGHGVPGEEVEGEAGVRGGEGGARMKGM